MVFFKMWSSKCEEPVSNWSQRWPQHLECRILPESFSSAHKPSHWPWCSQVWFHINVGFKSFPYLPGWPNVNWVPGNVMRSKHDMLKGIKRLIFFLLTVIFGSCCSPLTSTLASDLLVIWSNAHWWMDFTHLAIWSHAAHWCMDF